MAVGRIGWVKKAISAVAMIALVFGLSVRPAFAAEAPAGPAQHLELGRVRALVQVRVRVLLGQAPRQPESQAPSQEWV